MKVPSLLKVSPTHLIRVSDPDQEIFELYTRLAGSSEPSTKFNWAQEQRPTRCGSLGFLDSGSSTIQVRLEIHDVNQLKSNTTVHDLHENESKTKRRLKSKALKSSRLKDVGLPLVCKEIEVELKQDILATKYRSGDTGSIVWRASIDLAELLWYDLLFPVEDQSSPNDSRSQVSISHDRHDPCAGSCGSLMDMTLLVNSTQILELGSGTGCLSILSHSMFPSDSRSSWTCSDQFELLNNLSRNLIHNQIQFSTPTSVTNYSSDHPRLVTIEEIDWLQVETVWEKTRSSHLHRANHGDDQSGQNLKRSSHYDLILAVDCLYNESLTLPLIRTIDHFSHAGDEEDPSSSSSSKKSSPTLVLIVSELRSDEVLTGFLRDWLELVPAWNIFRVSDEALRQDLNLNISGPNYVVWCAWKN